MTSPTLCTQSDAEALAYEIAMKSPDNMADIWVRFFTTLLMCSKDKAVAQRLFGMIKVIQDIQRSPMSHDDSQFPLTQDECTRLAVQPLDLFMTAQLRLRDMLYVIETTYTPQPMVLQWYLEAAKKRANSFLLNDNQNQ